MKIKLTVKNIEHELSFEEAKSLYEELAKLFEKKYMTYPVYTEPHTPRPWEIPVDDYLTKVKD